MPLARKVGLNPGDVVLDGDPAPLPEKWQSPQFSAHVYCGQTAGWITMPLGMEIGSAQATLWIVLDGDPALSRKVAQQLPPLFSPCLSSLNGDPSQQLLSSC